MAIFRLARTRFLLLLLLPLMLVGCSGKSAAAFIGTWKVDPAFAAQAGGSSSAASSMINSISLVMRDDKTFTYDTVTTAEGTWTWNSGDNSVSLDVHKLAIAGAPDDVILTGTLDESGKLHLKQPSNEIVFAKQ